MIREALDLAQALGDDPFIPTTPPTPVTAKRRCRRHDWMVEQQTGHAHCNLCGAHRDDEAKTRNRRNRQRGASFERKVAKQLGGRRTGPLGGRDDVMVSDFAAVQTKRTQRLSMTEVRRYLDDLQRTYPTRVPLVIHALPGERDGVVILPLSAWVDLHGATDGGDR